jgi:hypothetical protein
VRKEVVALLWATPEERIGNITLHAGYGIDLVGHGETMAATTKEEAIHRAVHQWGVSCVIEVDDIATRSNPRFVYGK